MTTSLPRLVLVGAGHAHALVLRRWARSPIAASVTVIADQPSSTYFGMVPGVFAGDYDAEDAKIDVAALAHAAGARFVLARARRIVPGSNRIELEDGSSVPWDIASLDVGSTLRGLEWPGVRKHTIALRPVDGLVDRIDQRLARTGTAPARVVVVGGGPGGVEVAFTLQARLLKRHRATTEVILACRRGGLLPRYPDRARQVVLAEAEARGLTIAMLPEVRFADSEGIGFEDGHLDADLVLWTTGPAAPDVIRHSPLLHDGNGFVRVKPTLEVENEQGLFAVGDCASVAGLPWLSKSGANVVSQAPVLETNLRAALSGSAPKAWRPPSGMFSLLNLGQQRALAVIGDVAMSGHLAWRLKDRIDRGVVASFRLPAPAPAADVPEFRA